MAVVKQSRLFKPEKKSIKRMKSEYDAGNEVAAEIILADPVRYEGGLLIWAELFSERIKREAQHK